MNEEEVTLRFTVTVAVPAERWPSLLGEFAASITDAVTGYGLRTVEAVVENPPPVD